MQTNERNEEHILIPEFLPRFIYKERKHKVTRKNDLRLFIYCYGDVLKELTYIVAQVHDHYQYTHTCSPLILFQFY